MHLTSALVQATVRKTLIRASRDPRLADQLAPLEGRTFAVGLGSTKLVYEVRGGTFRGPLASGTAADVVVSGTVPVFVRLALRRTDLDAAFFSRHIQVEGSLALALRLKNIVDGFLY